MSCNMTQAIAVICRKVATFPVQVGRTAHLAVEEMKHRAADHDDGVAADHEHREPGGKSSVLRIDVAPVADAQRDDSAEEQALVRDRIEDDAERALLVVTTRDIAIETVARGGDEKDHDRGVALPFERLTAP